MTSKKDFRKKVKEILIRVNIKADKSGGITARIQKTEAWKNCGAVLLYYPLKNEADVLDLAGNALAAGKKVYFPRIRDNHIEFRQLENINSINTFRKNSFGIKEPGEKNALFTAADTESLLVITPGLAFDRKKNRLGRGGGYYDRFIGTLEEAGCGAVFLGVCFHDQLFSDIPVDRWDRKVDYICTEREFF